MARESSFSTFLDVTAAMRHIPSEQEREAERQQLRPQLVGLPGLGLKYVLERSSGPELSVLHEVAVDELIQRVGKIGWAALNPRA
ncbi:MAG TPA: hypothetical protein VK712_02665 [Verrucomicrobiae bacterium]|jgi:hypothetical protein|nr:hypothetical protein [Verrucomicrobiae bacterium]